MKKLLLVIAIVCSLMCVSTPVFAEENTTNVASVDSDKAKSAAFVVIYLLVFIIYLPICTGFGTTSEYIKLLEVLPRWYFG